MNRSVGLAFTVLVCACAVFLSVYRQSHGTRNLLQRSTLIGEARNWTTSSGHDPYAWISPTQVFTTREIGARTPCIYDIDTHTLTPVEPLAKLFDGNTPGNNRVTTWNLSPDCKQIIWCKSGERKVHIANLDGSGHRVWSLAGLKGLQEVTYVSWLRDASSWIAYGAGVNTSIPFGFTAKNAEPSSSPVTAIPIASAAKLETADAVDLVANRSLQVETVRTELGERIVSKGMPPVPEGMGMAEIDGSPDRTRLAWILKVQRASPLSSLTDIFRPNHRDTTRTYTLLCVSNWDGSHMREVGRVEVSESDVNRAGPRTIVWMPDSRHVSYIDDGKLYKIDVGG